MHLLKKSVLILLFFFGVSTVLSAQNITKAWATIPTDPLQANPSAQPLDVLRIDASGNLYTYYNPSMKVSKLVKISSTGVVTDLPRNVESAIYNFKTDAAGNLFSAVTNYSSGSFEFYKTKTTGENILLIKPTGNNSPFTVDASGNFYTFQYENGKNCVLKVDPNGTVSPEWLILPTNINGMLDISTDAAGNVFALFVVSNLNDFVYIINKYSPSGTLVKTYSAPNGSKFMSVHLDAAGNLYSKTYSTNQNIYSFTKILTNGSCVIIPNWGGGHCLVLLITQSLIQTGQYILLLVMVQV